MKKTTNSSSIDEKIFIRAIEKRVRKDIRIKKKLGKKKEIKILDDNSKEFRVTKDILQSIFGKVKNIIIVKKKSEADLIPTNLDREINKDLKSYLLNKKFETKQKIILNNVLEKEIMTYCKIKKLKIGDKEKKNELIELLEKTTPNTKYGLAKSFDKIRERLKTE